MATDFDLYEHRRRPLWSESDPAQIVYTARFTDYVLEAIEGWFSYVVGSNWYELHTDFGLGTPFVRLEMDIQKPLTPKNELTMPVLVEKLGSASLGFYVVGKRDATDISFVARFVCCMVDSETMKPTRIPDEFRQRIRAYIAVCESLDGTE
jgi:4-hydroxybenzoyl-CoA thioesterase